MKTRGLILLLLLAIPFTADAAKWQEISPVRVYELLSEGSGLWLIDVRSKAAFDNLHIEGSINIAPYELSLKRFSKNKILVLADSSLGETVARKAADDLSRKGYKRVFVLSGGLKAWRKASQPMIGDNPEWRLSQVYPTELNQVNDKRLLRIFDLRSKSDQKNAPLESTVPVAGDVLEEKLAELQKDLASNRKKGIAGQLQTPKTVVVVLPVATDGQSIHDQYLKRLPEDIRVLDGGYLVSGNQRKTKTVSTGDGCSTCPGG
jgi:rhodanese-related sulfurtransferase